MILTPEEEKIIEKARNSLNLQEAQVVLRMREYSYQTIVVHMEADKVVHKEQIQSIKE